jgi:hypothetical protein
VCQGLKVVRPTQGDPNKHRQSSDSQRKDDSEHNLDRAAVPDEVQRVGSAEADGNPTSDKCTEYGHSHEVSARTEQEQDGAVFTRLSDARKEGYTSLFPRYLATSTPPETAVLTFCTTSCGAILSASAAPASFGRSVTSGGITCGDSMAVLSTKRPWSALLASALRALIAERF